MGICRCQKCCPLEQTPFEKLSDRIAKLERAVYNCDASALKHPITAKDIDRWRKIEEAAKVVIAKAVQAQWIQLNGHVIPALREALKP